MPTDAVGLRASGPTPQNAEVFSLLVDAIPDYAIVTLDPQGRIKTWNAGAEVLTGYQAAEIVGQPIDSLCAPEAIAAEVPVRLLARATDAGCGHKEFWHVRKDGSRWLANVVLMALRDAAGQLAGFGEIARDVTERRAVENALRTSEEQLKQAQRLSHIGSIHIDIASEEVYWSDEIYRILGVEPAAFSPTMENYLPFVHPEDRHLARSMQEQVRHGSNPGPAEYRIARPDGVTRWVYRESEIRRDETGNIRTLISTIQDVTDRKAAEEALKNSADQLKRAQHLAQIGSAWWDIRTGNIEWSDETYRIYGVSRDEFIPSQDGVSAMIHPSDRDRLMADRELIARGVCPEPAEYRIIRPDGTIRRLYREFAPVTDATGALSAFVSTVHDVTEQRRTEDQLRQAQKMEAIGNLTGGLAHDFNNLLGIVIGNIDLLRDLKANEADIVELSQEALDAALKGAELTRRLLAFARQQPLAPRQVDVNELVSGITRLLSRTLGDDIEVSLELAPDIWATVVDPAQLESSLVNLANNSRDAMPFGGQLRFKTANRYLDADYASLHAEVAVGDYAVIEIGDTGSGMTPEVMSRIFEPFYTTKEQGRGTGLGLAMVFGFMKQSNGHVNVYSEPGIGTIFRLYIPRASADTGVSDEDLASPIAPGGSDTILVVEDNAPLRRVAARQLTEIGYRVIQAENAAAALDLLQSERIDLMLTDIAMPGGVDGIALAHQARDREPELKIVFTSGFPQTQLGGTAWQLPDGAQLLTKPYRRQELAAAVRAALG